MLQLYVRINTIYRNEVDYGFDIIITYVKITFDITPLHFQVTLVLGETLFLQSDSFIP